MNIWIISKYATSKEVGFESRIFAFAKRFVKLGHDVTVISSDSNHFGRYPNYKFLYNSEKTDGIDVFRIKTLKYYRTASLRRILSWLDFEWKLFFFPVRNLRKPDVIVVSSLSLLTIINGILLKNKYGCKLIFEIRDIWPLMMVEEGGYKSSNIFVHILGMVEKIGYRYADLVVGTMPNLKEHIIEVTGNHQIKCECVPFGFDASFYAEIQVNRAENRTKYNLPADKFIIGYAGSIGISNGLGAFISCIKKMAMDDRFFFAILGDGALRENYIEATEGLDNVVFISKVERAEVPSFLGSCDLLYFAALNSKIWQYGWSPNKLIDYMMSEKPVLASYSGFPSMINEAGSGFFIPAEDVDAIQAALLEIINIPKRVMNEMGTKGKDWLVSNRNWDTISQEYLQAIELIMYDRK